MAKSIAFFDTEVGVDDQRIHDAGAIREGEVFHGAGVRSLCAFLSKADYLCGHNVIRHDLSYIEKAGEHPGTEKVIDTLFLSPLLFPEKPYHRLLKDDKLQVEELNNPVNDSKKAEELFWDEVNAFRSLPVSRKKIFYGLLKNVREFRWFFDYLEYRPLIINLGGLIRQEYDGRICAHAELDVLIAGHPVELSYSLALCAVKDAYSITPPWLTHTYPYVENILKILRGSPCKEGCRYCLSAHDIHRSLKQIFGYENFRTYNGEPLQEKAAQAAVDGKSLLAVFPTGGGKSVTFQLPALMAGKAVHGLTVVISPLQSLMKDQVDNLARAGITEAVTVNGLLSPIERSDALRRVEDGSASLLYISPEQLRSKTVERLISGRNVVRFVIDEAHCFSAWGQDFRVDYLFIGDFIRELSKKKNGMPIPVSCFTATAKQKVIMDICDYFKRKLGTDLCLFASDAARENLHYAVLYRETEEEKYNTLRDLIAEKDCPTIVYVTRVKRTVQLSDRLTADGFPARPYNGKMDSTEKILCQEDFMENRIKVIVATSAFGMGVDKKDVRLVVHYDISDSLENYVQEAGRAGRDPNLEAECFVLYNDGDLDKHFILLNQTKLSISEIQQVWRAIKELTRFRKSVSCSALEIARQAGWDESVSDVETRVKTAVAALENAGYVKRGQNVPHVYATGIAVKNMAEASFCIENSALLSGDQKTGARRIIKSLITARSIAGGDREDAESRVDYLADMLGMEKEEVVNIINLMRQEGILADSLDMSAYIFRSDTRNRSMQILSRFSKLEEFLLRRIHENDRDSYLDMKKLNEAAADAGITGSNVKNIITILGFLHIKKYIQKVENKETRTVETVLSMGYERTLEKFHKRTELSGFILEHLFEKAAEVPDAEKKEEIPVEFSLVSLFQLWCETPHLSLGEPAAMSDMEDALLYLSKIGAVKLEGGFLVLYNAMELKRLVTDNRVRYKLEDYRLLDEFYKQKIRQVHIVGEYANLMVRDYDAALRYVRDYFLLDHKEFTAKYFKGNRAKQIERNITPAKYEQLFGSLSDIQEKIINDRESKYIVVAAGPGSGKTRVLVHKLAALLLLDDVKHEQLLMVTFSRAAATEFKKRLYGLIGNAAGFVEIKTFHSYCFDLLGRVGNLEASQDVVKKAAEMIAKEEVEPSRIMKTVLVIDEAQDMDANEYALVRALLKVNDDCRVIAVGDDDQNIYGFRGSDAVYMRSLITEYGAACYEMNENYRSFRNVVAFANAFIAPLAGRMKTKPSVSVGKEPGIVRVTHHTALRMEEAVAETVAETYHGGSSCVLTWTNDEALCLQGLLIRKGIRAKLIQSLGGFRLYDLMEIRHFLRYIDHHSRSPVISRKTWADAKKKIEEIYAGSACLEILRNLWADFEKVYPGMYRSDLEELIRESQYEDFYDEPGEAVLVSTIHKSKGHEFDTVYMMLHGRDSGTEEERRVLYVGMTRARKELYIHCNTDIFSRIRVPEAEWREDRRNFTEPAEITLQLGHPDVYLGYFKARKAVTVKLRSGMPLSVSGIYLTAEISGRAVNVARFSARRIAELERLSGLGYRITGARVRFIVAWTDKNDNTEVPILLADLSLRKDL